MSVDEIFFPPGVHQATVQKQKHFPFSELAFFFLLLWGQE